MRREFREFRSQLPSVARWAFPSAFVFLLLALLYGYTAKEAVAATAGFTVGVVPLMLGLFWARIWPGQSWARLRFALAWAAVLFLPGVILGSLAALLVRRALGAP